MKYALYCTLTFHPLSTSLVKLPHKVHKTFRLSGFHGQVGFCYRFTKNRIATILDFQRSKFYGQVRYSLGAHLIEGCQYITSRAFSLRFFFVLFGENASVVLQDPSYPGR